MDEILSFPSDNKFLTDLKKIMPSNKILLSYINEQKEIVIYIGDFETKELVWASKVLTLHAENRILVELGMADIIE